MKLRINFKVNQATLRCVIAAAGLMVGALASATTAVDTLRDFARDVSSAKAEFTQTVTSPDGLKKKTSSGHFEFVRPNRFRFAYVKPFAQLIVSDGRKVWLHDVDLNQVSVRNFDQALGATPVALLSGNGLERDFELSALPARDGLDWVHAVPRAKEGNIESLNVGFKGGALAALEIVDAFGQRSLIRFSQLVTNPTLPDASFQFSPPKGADVVEQR